MTIYYIYLAVAIGAEIVATTLLKYSESFTKLLPSVGAVLAYVVCYYFFSKAILKINLGIAYATWCGVGIICTCLISMFVFHEKTNWISLVGIAMIGLGCVIVNLYGN